jgi:CubicO group peptidase (beta-lactamase class C family)
VGDTKRRVNCHSLRKSFLSALYGVFIENRTINPLDTIKDSIAIPIGMEDFKVSGCEYVSAHTSIHPAYVFRMSARDRARYGLLFLRNGKWQNKQIIPEIYVDCCTICW